MSIGIGIWRFVGHAGDMSKPAVLHRIRSALDSQLESMRAAARDARESATSEESKQEGKYDTRAIEASYLAGAQAERAAWLAEAVRHFDTFDPPIFDEDEEIGPGALVECEHGGEIVFYLLAPAGGGVTVEHDGYDCTVLTPESPLYQELLGARAGEIVAGPALMVLSVT